MTDLIEQGICPLVDAINGLGFARTVYSCEGHFDEEPREKFLPTAYVTFGVRDAATFSGLYDRIRSIDGTLEKVSIRLTYDCLVGRYTLSLWADASVQDPSRKRVLVDAACREVSETVRSHENGAIYFRPPNASRENLPCANEYVPPCTLVIPPKRLNCPFAGITGEGPEKSG